MPEKANETEAGKTAVKTPGRIVIITSDATGRPVAVSRGNWAEELIKLANGELVELAIAVYPMGIETTLPMGVIKFRTVSYAEQSTAN